MADEATTFEVLKKDAPAQGRPRRRKRKKMARKRKTKTERLTEAAFSEVKRDEPSIVGETRAKKGEAAAERQKTAIALSKARRAGARIPKKRKRRKRKRFTDRTLF